MRNALSALSSSRQDTRRVRCGCRAPKHLARALSTPPLFKCTRIVPVEAFCSQQSARMGVSWLLSARAPSAREWRLLFPSVRTKSLPSHKQGVHSGVSWLLSARAPSVFPCCSPRSCARPPPVVVSPWVHCQHLRKNTCSSRALEPLCELLPVFPLLVSRSCRSFSTLRQHAFSFLGCSPSRNRSAQWRITFPF